MEELLLIEEEIVGKKNHLRSIYIENLKDVAVDNMVIVKRSKERCDPYCKVLASWYEILLKNGNMVKVFILDREQDTVSIENIVADRRNMGIIYIQTWKWDSDKKEIIRYDLKDKKGGKVADTDLRSRIYPGTIPAFIKDGKVRTLDGRVLYEIPEGWRIEYDLGDVQYIDQNNYAICMTRKEEEWKSRVIWNRNGKLEEILLRDMACTNLRILGELIVVKSYKRIAVISGNSVIRMLFPTEVGVLLTRKEYEFIREILDLPREGEEEIKINY